MYRCLLIALLLLAACSPKPRTIIAEPLDEHDRAQDQDYCQRYAEKFGVINMDPLLSGSGMEDFPDKKRQLQLFEACMYRKGYRFH